MSESARLVIDAHQHVWDLRRATYSWLGPHLPEVHRTFTFEELQPQLRAAGVGATVLVQSADDDADTDLMVAVADEHPTVAAIVGYVPLDRPAAAAARLDVLRRDPRLVGVRNLVHEQADPDWVLRPDVDEGLGLLEKAGLSFDYVAVLPRHLEHVPVLGERHPDLRIVIDHLSKPPIGRPDTEPWWSLIATAAQNPNVHGKVSGLYPGQHPRAWTPTSIRPFVERAVEVFGPERLMVGGDWPISVMAGGYEHVWAGLSEVLTGLLDPAELAEVMAGTAQRFYRIPAGLLARALTEA